MTPVIFISFLVSLAWVDLRYSIMRSHSHSDENSSRMPRWLHAILYCQSPYQYVRVDRSQSNSPTTDAKWHYHTKQRKLMKMEAEDAFRIRGSVLVVMGLLAVAGPWAVWRLVWGLWLIVTARVGAGDAGAAWRAA